MDPTWITKYYKPSQSDFVAKIEPFLPNGCLGMSLQLSAFILSISDLIIAAFQLAYANAYYYDPLIVKIYLGFVVTYFFEAQWIILPLSCPWKSVFFYFILCYDLYFFWNLGYYLFEIWLFLLKIWLFWLEIWLFLPEIFLFLIEIWPYKPKIWQICLKFG